MGCECARSSQAPQPPRDVQDPVGPSRLSQHSSQGVMSQPGGAGGQEQCPCPCPCQGLRPRDTHWREVRAWFSLMAKAMAWPPSSHSRLAARLQGHRTQVTQEKLRTAPGTAWGGLGALVGPPWDLLQLPEGAVAAQGTGDGRAPLSADGVLPEAGERHGPGEGQPGQGWGCCSPRAPSPPAPG